MLEINEIKGRQMKKKQPLDLSLFRSAESHYSFALCKRNPNDLPGLHYDAITRKTNIPRGLLVDRY